MIYFSLTSSFTTYTDLTEVNAARVWNWRVTRLFISIKYSLKFLLALYLPSTVYFFPWQIKIVSQKLINSCTIIDMTVAH